jgi:lipoteichoic acid synthase
MLADTLLVVVGDHGEAFGEHELIWHTGVPYDEALRIPAIVRLPADLRRTGRVRGLRQQIDLWPTVAEVLGLEVRGGAAPGRSLLSDDDGHRALYFTTHFDNASLAMRDGDRKYIYWFGRRPMEVYDLARDPGEKVDRADEVPASELVAAERDLRAWLRAVRATYVGEQP